MTGRHDLVALSLGAGVQSTTLALLAVEGVLPKPDVAIFADTGWEPRAVYDHLGRLEVVLNAAGIKVLRVSSGNLREDAINPAHRYASIPYYVRNAPGPCTRCDGTRSTRIVDTDAVHLGEPVELGEPRTCPRCRGSGEEPPEGMGRRQCTSEYKLVPIRRKIREILGATPPDYKRVPSGRVCQQWVGFSTDEVHRANRRKDSDGVRYLTTEYPLLDLGMSRDDCERWLRARGWTATKSACIGCPFHGNRQWRELRDNHPDEWADAVDFDQQIRKGGARGLPLNGEAFLHRSRVPLELAPIDRVTRAEWADRQTDIFGQIADLEEEGDVDGCSPYGCRSGEQADEDDLEPTGTET